MSQKQSKYVWSFNKFLPQFGEPLSAEQYLAQNNSKYTVCQYYTFLERQYSTPLKYILELVYDDLNIPIDVINIITVYNSGGIIYDYTKSFEEYTKGSVVYVTPIILGYIETFLFCSLFFLMYLMHFQFKYEIFANPDAYQMMNRTLLLIAVIYSLFLCIHTICVFISFHQCKQYEVILRHFKRSLYSNKNFFNHIRMIDMKEQQDNDEDDDSLNPTDSSESNTIPENARLRTTSHDSHRAIFTLDISEDGSDETHDDEDEDSSSRDDTHPVREDSDIMDRWQWNETYKEKQQHEFLSILNPSNNSFAYVAYQRWLNVKKLELENDSFTRSKSALVLNLSKYWLTSYFTLIIILIFVIPNSVYLYFAFVLTLFVMYYCYLRTIKNLDHSAALKKVLYLFCSFVIGTIITLIIIFTTEDPSSVNGGNVTSSSSTTASSGVHNDNNPENVNNGAHGVDTAAMNAENGGVTFWIFDVIFPILEGVFALLYSYITINLVYKIVKFGHQGYHLWLCCVNAFGFWLLTFWIPSWKVTEISILCTAMLLVSCYLYLQQISHRIMTGLNKHEYITKHCARKPKEWLKNEIKQLFVPYTYCQSE